MNERERMEKILKEFYSGRTRPMSEVFPKWKAARGGIRYTPPTLEMWIAPGIKEPG